MREVTLFWKRSRIKNLDIGELTDLFKQAEFICYVKRVPKDIRIILKVNFCEGKTPDDLVDLHFLELLDIILEPKDISLIFILLLGSLYMLDFKTYTLWVDFSNLGKLLFFT